VPITPWTDRAASPSPDADEPVPRLASFLRLPGYQAGCSDSRAPLEFGGDRIEIPLGRIDLPAREQTVQAGASCSYGVSQCAGASLAGIIRGGRLESDEPILERGYLARRNGPATSGLV
jgi:hypothetical protein